MSKEKENLIQSKALKASICVAKSLSPSSRIKSPTKKLMSQKKNLL